MGNTDCCCTRGRDKLPNDEPLKGDEEEFIGQFNSQKSGLKTIETDENLNNTIRSMSSRGGLEKKSYMSNKQGILESDVKLYNNFQTFGGEIKDVDEYNSNLTKERELEINTVNRQTITENSKKSKMKNQETGNSPKIPKMVKINHKIFVRISVESLTILYRKLEEFGIFFNPHVVIKIESEIPNVIYPLGSENSNLMESNLEKSLNTSDLSDLENTMILNMSQIKSNTSFSIQTKKEKILNFKFSDCYEIPAQLAYTKVVFMVKNENITGTGNEEDSKKKSNSFPQICLGEAKIPLNLIFKNFRENSFEGNLEIKLRDVITIGYLKVRVSASDKLEKLKLQDELSEKLSKAKFINYEAEEKANFFEKNPIDNIFDLISNQSLKNSIYLWEENIINYEDLNPVIFAKYFTNDIKVDPQEALILANKIPRLKNDSRHGTKDTRETRDTKESKFKNKFDHSEMPIYLNEIINQNNHIALYQYLNYLVDLSMKDDFTSISVILKSLYEEDKNFLVNLPKTYPDNIFLLKLYLIFVFHYVKYYKHNKLSTIRINKELEDNVIILNLIDILNQIFKKTTLVTSLNPEYIQEMRDCALMCLNITGELITQPVDISSKMSLEEKKEEYTTIYENCIQLISARNSILRLLNFYISDSQIIGSIFRIFRKIIQILTNDNSSLLDENKFKPKNFSSSLRKFMIHQHEGVFISTIKSVLLRYHHYPEIHNNILFIMFQLTNYCPSNLLYFAAEKINLNLFSDTFESYRGRIKNSSYRTLNNVHLSVLSNLCEVDPNSESYNTVMELISNDLKSFYALTDENKKRREEFLVKKLTHLEIHEIVTRIGVKLTRNAKFSKILNTNSFFFNDIIEYVYTIAYNEFIENKKINKKTQTRHTDFTVENNIDFITKINEKKRNFSEEEISRYTYNITENTINIFNNLINSEDESLYTMLTYKLNEYEIKNTSLLNLMLERCLTLLENHGLDIVKLGELIENLNGHFDVEGNDSG